ncbi:MAG TPA: hypothetical protein ENK57_19800 [Polyangiaceae bacterium]|nr:hypothetical protein [Polyangiaceae bacterium]
MPWSSARPAGRGSCAPRRADDATQGRTAVECAQLIQAQRGFQSNARAITVQDELLSEIVNIV